MCASCFSSRTPCEPRRFSCFSFSSLALGACPSGSDSETDESDEPSVEWPAEPDNGAPVAAEFLGWDGEGEDRSAELRLFNFSDREVRQVRIDLNFLDESGAEISDQPHMDMRRLGAGEHSDIGAGFMIEAAAVSVNPVVTRVIFADGEEWEGEGTPDAAPVPPRQPTIEVINAPLPQGPIGMAELMANEDGVLAGWVGQTLTVDALFLNSTRVDGVLNTISIAASREDPFAVDLGCIVAEGQADPALVQYTPIRIQGTLSSRSALRGNQTIWTYDLEGCTVVSSGEGSGDTP